jgi:hypothetical protein
MPDKYDYTEEDMIEAAALLDRMAPTLSHGGRRAAKLLSNIFMGVDVSPQGTPDDDYWPGAVSILLPCRENDKQIGHAAVLVQSNPGSEPHVSARFLPLESVEDEPKQPVRGLPFEPQDDEEDDGQVHGESRTDPSDGNTYVKLDDMSNDTRTTICDIFGGHEHVIPTSEWLSWEPVANEKEEA